METKTTRNGFLFLGITLFVQAVTSLMGGLMFKGLVSVADIAATMSNLAHHVFSVNISIFLQMVTAMVIIMLGVAIYHTAGHINKTMAVLGLLFYALEATLLAVSQTFTFGLMKASQLYMSTNDAGLLNLGSALFAGNDFAAKIAMIPFGLGAILFYYLLMKAQIIPRWLALWGLVTAPFILVGIPLMAFGVKVPILLLAPYVPFEFFTGIYIMIKYRKKIILKSIDNSLTLKLQ